MDNLLDNLVLMTDMVYNPLDLILQTMHDLTVKIWYLPHHLYGSLFAKASVAEEGGGGGKSPPPLKSSRKQSKEGTEQI